MDSLKQSIEELIAERDDLKNELDRTRERGGAMFENSVAKAVYDRVKVERDRLSEVVAEQATRIGELHVQLAHTRNTIMVLHAQIEALIAERDDLKNELARTRNTIMLLHAQIEALK